MGEYFELTFFSPKAGQKRDELHRFQELLNVKKDCHTAPQENRFSFVDNRDLYFTAIERSDYYEWELSVAEIQITPGNLQSIQFQMLELVDACFRQCPSLALVTGIYEATDYYLAGITSWNDFNRQNLSNFPFLFFREECQFGFTAKDRFHNVWLVINQGKEVQDIFS